MTLLTKSELGVIEHLLTEAGCVRPQDRCLLLFDESTADLVEGFKMVAAQLSLSLTLATVPLANRHGTEAPIKVRRQMMEHTLIIALTHFSLAHTQSRLDAARCGARFLSMPMYNRAMLADPCLCFPYRQQRQTVEAFTQAFNAGKRIQVTTSIGTNIWLNIDGRQGNCCPGYVSQAGELGSPPDIESNISPLEYESSGVVVIDGSITCPEFGLLQSPIWLTVKNGRIVTIQSERADYVTTLERILGPLNSKRRILAECGVGLNPAASLTGNMLTDEGALGCLHFGFGANSTVGGINNVDFHLDFVFRNPTLKVDERLLIENGEILL